MIVQHIIPRLGDMLIAKVKPAHLQSFYRWLELPEDEGGAGLTGTTPLKYHRLLHLAFRYAVRWEIIQSNPADAAEAPKATPDEMHFLSESELSTVLDALEGTAAHIPVLLAASTGMRLGEICGLQNEDIDLDAGMIYVRHQSQRINGKMVLRTTKTHRSRRPIAILPDTMPELRRYILQCKKDRLAHGPAYDDNNYFCK